MNRHFRYDFLKLKLGFWVFFQSALANRSERLLRCLSIAVLFCIEIFGVLNMDSEDPNFICAFVLACIDLYAISMLD